MKYRVFVTKSEAVAAEQAISQDLGYPKPGINAAIGKVEPTILTTRWALPKQIQDGRWVFASPDDEGIEAQEDWFATNIDNLQIYKIVD